MLNFKDTQCKITSKMTARYKITLLHVKNINTEVVLRGKICLILFVSLVCIFQVNNKKTIYVKKNEN